MKNNFQLSIPKPCAEKWENFTPTLNGGFCSSCNKVVIDFTKMTDDEIIHFFKNKPTHACGRLQPDQLKTYSYPIVSKSNSSFALFKTGFVGLLILLLNKPTLAQNKTTKLKADSAQYIDNVKEESEDDTSGGYVVKGVVKDELDGLAMPGINIVLKGTDIGTITNVDGQFEFPAKLKEGDVLNFSFIGYKTEEYKIPKGNNNMELQIQLTMDMDLDLTGEIVVGGVYSEKKSSVSRWWAKVKNAF